MLQFIRHTVLSGGDRNLWPAILDLASSYGWLICTMNFKSISPLRFGRGCNPLQEFDIGLLLAFLAYFVVITTCKFFAVMASVVAAMMHDASYCVLSKLNMFLIDESSLFAILAVLRLMTFE